MLRSRGARAALLALIGSTAAARAGAQTPPPSPAPAPAPAAATPAAPSTGTPAGTSGGGAPSETTAKGGTGTDDANAAKPPGVTGGYSWSEKPARRRQHVRKKEQPIDPHAPLATYPGFRMLPDGTSRLSVRISKPVDVKVTRAPGRVVFFLPGVQIGIRNNTHPLITTHFNTPVSVAQLKRDKDGAELIVELRERVEPTHKLVKAPDGMVLEVMLPRARRDYSTLADAPEPAAAGSRRIGRRQSSRRPSGRRGPEM